MSELQPAPGRVLVWRMEDKKGRGPIALANRRALREVYEACLLTTPPQRDGGELQARWRRDGSMLPWRFGCTSEEQLRQWFVPKVQPRLAAKGFRVVCFDVAREHVLFGQSQVAFVYRKALPVFYTI